MTIRSKVTAGALASAIAGYVFNLLDAKFGFEFDPTLSALVVAALTAVVTFAAGFLKREHVITEAEYDSFVGSDADREVTATAEKQVEEFAPAVVDGSVALSAAADAAPAAEAVADTPEPVAASEDTETATAGVEILDGSNPAVWNT